MELDTDAIWVEFESAVAYETKRRRKDEAIFGVDENDSRLSFKCANTDMVEVVELGNGDWHVCKGKRCQYITIDADRNYVCSISGLSFCAEFAESSDACWTGRSTSSGDPDHVGGTPIGGWRPRRDAFAESQRAFEAAKLINDSEVTYVESAKEKAAREARSAQRRGALCVDEVEVETGPPKKTRTARRTMSKEFFEKLGAEASVVMDRLTQTKTAVNKTEKDGMPPPPPPKADPRLQSFEFVKKLLMRKHMDRASKGLERFDIDSVHNVFLKANAFAKAQRAKSEITVAKKRANFSGETKSRMVALILALWRAVCATPFLRDEEAKRGADSFRPFVSGVLYALKRGVKLQNGLEIIPSIPSLADQLPTLRSTDATAAARQLQSASHRGLCTLHKSVCSLEQVTEDTFESFNEAHVALQDAARVAAQLTSFVN